MKKILFTLLALLFFNSYVNAETFKFTQVTDVHYPKTGITGYEGRSFDFAIKNYNYIESDYVYLHRARKSDIDKNGEIIAKLGVENRESVTYDDLPQVLIE